MRTCRADMSSPDAKALGFKWPESGPVECHDWSPEAECGHGLHGLLWGEGDGQTLCWDTDAKWLAVAVAEKSIVALGGKVKFPRGRVVLVGDGASVADLIQQHAPKGTCVVRGTAMAGYRGTAMAGDGGTATAGYGGSIAIRWWDGDSSRYRIRAFDVGENGIKAQTKYRLDDRGQVVEVPAETSVAK